MNAETLQRLVDAEELRALAGAYVTAADRGLSRDLADLFVADGILDIRGDGFDAGVHRTREAIFALLEANRARLSGSMDAPLLRHHVSSIRHDFSDPEQPRGACYFLAVTEVGPDHWGRYDDRYARVDGRWRFAHRKVMLEGWADGSWMDRRLAIERGR